MCRRCKASILSMLQLLLCKRTGDKFSEVLFYPPIHVQCKRGEQGIQMHSLEILLSKFASVQQVRCDWRVMYRNGKRRGKDEDKQDEP